MKYTYLWIMLAMAVMLCAPAQAQERRLPSSQAEVKLSFAPLVKNAAPAVVNIYTKKKVKVQLSPLFNDPFFQQFFGNMGALRERTQNSLGSGVVVSENGRIMTSNHVVVGSDEVTVVLSDRREYPAKIVLADEKTDLAVLSINTEGEKLPSLALADSDRLEVGDMVLAIGNPFGVGQTVTSGIVSALARTTMGVADYQFFIQTDAAINPGNSGGALIDMDGKLVGINTAIYSRSGGSNGIGFAIPANMVKTVLRSVDNGGKVVRPWLGLGTQEVTADIASGLGMKAPRGVLVKEVYSGSPIEQAGVKVGDVILGVDEHGTDTGQALRFRIATYDLGSTVQLKVLRNGKEMNLPLTMKAAPETPARDKRVIAGKTPLSGATVLNLSPAVSEELDMPQIYKGVVIEQVGGIAARLGFQAGDIVREINGVKVNSTRELEKLLKNAGVGWRITVQRGGKTLTVAWTGGGQ